MPRPDYAPPELRAPRHSAGRRAVDPAACDAADDWDQLFAAVTARLGKGLAAPPAAGDGLRALVAQCLQALVQLQAMRAQQRSCECGLDRELTGSSDALGMAHVAQARARACEHQARHQALHDGLTSLPDRSSFSERLDHELSSGGQRAQALAVLFLDLDGVKPINDRHGHDTGDELLRIVAARLHCAVRKQDLVCRLGGDEFACLLPEPNGRAELSQVAAKLFDAVSAPLKLGGLQLSVRPSIGIAMCPADGDTAATLLKRADSAMVRAKRRQLGFAFFDRIADV